MKNEGHVNCVAGIFATCDNESRHERANKSGSWRDVAGFRILRQSFYIPSGGAVVAENEAIKGWDFEAPASVVTRIEVGGKPVIINGIMPRL